MGRFSSLTALSRRGVNLALVALLRIRLSGIHAIVFVNRLTRFSGVMLLWLKSVRLRQQQFNGYWSHLIASDQQEHSMVRCISGSWRGHEPRRRDRVHSPVLLSVHLGFCNDRTKGGTHRSMDSPAFRGESTLLHRRWLPSDLARCATIPLHQRSRAESEAN